MLKNNKIFKTSDLQKLDKYTIENEPVTSLDLMERAATVFTEKLLIFFPNNHIFNILAGFGNNGGDGYVVARLLLKKGLNVKVFGLHGNSVLSPDCAVNSYGWQCRRYSGHAPGFLWIADSTIHPGRMGRIYSGEGFPRKASPY